MRPLFRSGHDGVPVRQGTPDDDRRLRLLNNRYRLERRLGRGGMGAVYAAVDDVLDAPLR